MARRLTDDVDQWESENHPIPGSGFVYYDKVFFLPHIVLGTPLCTMAVAARQVWPMEADGMAGQGFTLHLHIGKHATALLKR